MNDRILRITLRSNCPYFSSFSTEDPESFKDAIISYLFTRNSRTTKADRRYRSKLYSYCDPCSQWEQWPVVMPVKFSKDKNRVGQFHRCSKARCFQTLIIRISFHHGEAAVPVLADHRCFNKARRSNTVEYIWSPFLRNLSFAWNASRLSSNKASPVRRNRSIHTGAQILVALFKIVSRAYAGPAILALPRAFCPVRTSAPRTMRTRACAIGQLS